ncbi:hypothetical protein DSO57_1026232 [Entomophthora muscae]|uniref:Uncharacterized protein n=1 Tax=Entomophthora muscae TaxID=34485 RepID=A0ACC2SRU0_9FUNG|nr:hypothetical protein DSO57_1026232 [Entomophthora muscae]
MAAPHQETFLSTPDGDIQEVYTVYQDQLVLTSVYNQLHLGQSNISVIPPQSYLLQHMLNLQLDPFAETCLCICQVPEPMWVAAASGRLTGPAVVWFNNWASQEHKVSWTTFRDIIRSRYSKTFLPIVVETTLIAIKQTGSVPKYFAAWQQALVAAPNVTENSIIPGIIQPSRKAWKARKPLTKLTDLTDLNQMVD